MKRLLTSFIFSLLLITISEAATFYVATTGNDSNPGTLAAPFRTLSKGISVLASGDTLFIRAGSYASAQIMGNIPAGSSWSAPTTVSAYSGETVTFTGSSGYHTVHFNNGSQRFIVLKDVIIDAALGGSGSDGVKIDNGASRIRLHGVEIKNFGKQGVLMPWVAAGVGGFNELINCHVHNGGTRTDYDHGLYISVDDVLVDGCIIHDNTGWGIHKYDQGDRLTVRNTLVYNQPSNPCIGLVSNNGGHKVYNNTVVGPCGYNAGIATWYGPTNSEIFNNTLINAGVYVYQIGSGITFDNNLLSGAGFNIEQAGSSFNVRNNLASSYGGSASGQGVLSNNLFGSQYTPAFVNAASGNYRLQSNSAAINAGRTTATAVDRDGNPRPQGPAYDIGAFEFASGQTITPPSNLQISAQ